MTDLVDIINLIIELIYKYIDTIEIEIEIKMEPTTRKRRYI
jgi:hypothetical protein